MTPANRPTVHHRPATAISCGMILVVGFLVIALPACGSAGSPSSSGASSSSLSPSRSPLLAALVHTPPGSESYDPVVVQMLLDLSAAGRTKEQLVADELSPYAPQTLTAETVQAFVKRACPS